MKAADRFFRVMTALVAFLSGCAKNSHKHLETLSYTAPVRNRNLIVFLRGLGGTWRCIWHPHTCFEREGFVAAARNRKIPFDMVAPNAHFGYYKDRNLEVRLTEDVIGPAKAQGYEKIWLVGASMGGLGSIFYLRKHPEYVAGVLLLGPYLGDAPIASEISQAGGIKAWNPGSYDGERDWQRRVWDWLKRYCAAPDGRVPIYLGIGKQDRYYNGQKLLADALPAERVIVVDGRHGPTTFKKIWEIFLERNILSNS